MTNREIDYVFEKFGPSISSIHTFDYDILSSSWTRMPKMEILKFVLPKLFSKN